MRERAKERINRWYFWAGEHPGTVGLVALGIGIVSTIFAATAIVQVREQGHRITRIERPSACEEDAAGFRCQHTKQESARAASIYTTCIPFKKVGYLCPRPGSGVTIRPSERGHGVLEPPPSAEGVLPTRGQRHPHHVEPAPTHSGGHQAQPAPAPGPAAPGAEPPSSAQAPETSAPTSPPAADEPTTEPPAEPCAPAPLDPVVKLRLELAGVKLCA